MVKSQTINISTSGICDVQNITDRIQSFVNQIGVSEGLACIAVVGSTAGVTAIEYEPNLVKDFKELMEKLVPQNLKTKHGDTWGDDNGFSHLRASLIGPSISIPIKNSQLQLGTWQQIVLCDFDNRPREREVVIQVVGE